MQTHNWTIPLLLPLQKVVPLQYKQSQWQRLRKESSFCNSWFPTYWELLNSTFIAEDINWNPFHVFILLDQMQCQLWYMLKALKILCHINQLGRPPVQVIDWHCNILSMTFSFKEIYHEVDNCQVLGETTHIKFKFRNVTVFLWCPLPCNAEWYPHFIY